MTTVIISSTVFFDLHIRYANIYLVEKVRKTAGDQIVFKSKSFCLEIIHLPYLNIK